MEKRRTCPQRKELTQERNEDLFNAYSEVLKKHGKYASKMAKKELYIDLVEMPAPRFYITPEEAGRIVASMLKRCHNV